MTRYRQYFYCIDKLSGTVGVYNFNIIFRSEACKKATLPPLIILYLNLKPKAFLSSSDPPNFDVELDMKYPISLSSQSFELGSLD